MSQVPVQVPNATSGTALKFPRWMMVEDEEMETKVKMQRTEVTWSFLPWWEKNNRSNTAVLSLYTQELDVS